MREVKVHTHAQLGKHIPIPPKVGTSMGINEWIRRILYMDY
jgi:hypothetical protein